MATQHSFRARLVWSKGGQGSNSGNHRVEFGGRPALELSAAAHYRGDPSKLNPEELFLSSLASCQMLTYLSLAGRAGIDVLAYEDGAEATLAIADRKMRITEVVLHPRITIGATGDEAKARSLVDSAHDGCFIANSVACPVRTEAQIVRAA